MRLIDLARRSKPEAGIAGHLETLRGLGFDHVAYAGINPLSETIHGHVTYSEGWKAHYAEHELHRSDPALLKVSRSIAPVDWSRFRGDPAFDGLTRAGHDFGVPFNGVTLPVRGPLGDVGLLSVSSHAGDAEWAKLKAARLVALHSLAVTLHDEAMHLDPLTREMSPPTLSTREAEVLQWVAAGRSQADIAAILAISSRTVEVHLSSARRKLSALSTAQAVGRAIAMGLILPQ